MALREISSMDSFGDWVRNRRQALNLTRVQLAGKVGCAPVTVKKIEGDERKPSRQMAELLAEQLLIPRLEREVFFRKARGILEDRLTPLETSLHLPAFQQQDIRPFQPATPFVGRQIELTRLMTFLDQALAGNTSPVFLMGEAGSGKTTLMREFARKAQAAYPELLIAGGQCNAQTGPGDPYRPFRDILGILTGDLEIDLTVGMLNREQAIRLWMAIPEMVKSIMAAGPHLLDILVPVKPLIHRLAPYLGDNSDWFDQVQNFSDKKPSGSSDLEQGQVLDELTRVLRSIAENYPLLLILDDLQWADGASLNLLYHLGRRLAGSRVLLLNSYRTGETIARSADSKGDTQGTHSPENLILELTRQYGDIQIRLDQTSPSEGRAFIDSLLDLEPNRLGNQFRENLYDQTQGHPLFTVEMLDSMRRNRNILLDQAGYWVENRSGTAAPRPARVEALIEQKLAHLDPQQRELLNIASVEGERFTLEIVAGVGDLDPDAAMKSFTHDLGQQFHLIREQGQARLDVLSLNRYQFHHILIQDYLYSQLEPAEKRRLHLKIAQELEKVLLMIPPRQAVDLTNFSNGLPLESTEVLDMFGPALLHHFSMGEDWLKAARYAHQLGKLARQRFAMREAMNYEEQALLALDHQPGILEEETYDSILDWEEAAFKFRPYQEQLQNLARAEAIARKINDKPRLIQVLHWTANVLLARGLWTQAGPALTESLSLAEELPDERLSVRPTYFKALMTTFADPYQSLKWIDQAEGLARKYGDLQFEALALGTAGQVLAQLGEFDQSQTAIQHARQLSDRLGSPLTDSDVDLFAAWASLAMGHWEQALEFGQRSVEKAIATDNMDCICNALTCIGYINLEMGRIPQAASAFEKGIERSDISGAMIPKLNGQAGLAMTRFANGHPEAIEELEEVASNMRQVQFHVGAANADLMLAMCYFNVHDLQHASDHLNLAVAFYQTSRMQPSLVKTQKIKEELMSRQASNPGS